MIAELSAQDLFFLAETCAQAEDYYNATFTMIMGQIRASSDMAVFRPDGEAAEVAAGMLYMSIFYVYGGAGYPVIYRDEDATNRLFSQIQNTPLQISDAYNPGWDYTAESRTDLYDDVVESMKAERTWQLKNYASLVRNDEWYDLQQRQDDLQQQMNGVPFEVGTPEYDEMQSLSAKQLAIGSAIEQLPPPEIKLPFEELNAPPKDVADRQLANGFNGPKEAGAAIWRSEEEVRSSWIAVALGDDELAELLKKVDFRFELLVSYAFGRRRNAAGTISLQQLNYREAFSGYSVSTIIAVVPKECGIEFADSFPFVIGKVEAVPDAEVNGSSSSNYPVDCGPIVSAEPADGQP